jgi:hypothetical protein
VLLQLVLKGMLREKQVNQVFGKADSPVSGRYNATIQAFRNQGNTL